MKTYFYASFTWWLYSLTRLFIIFVNSFTCEYSSSCCCGSGKRGWWKEAAAAAVDCCWCCWHGPCCSSCCCCCRWWWDCWWGCWRWWWGRCTADSGAGKFSFLCWIWSLNGKVKLPYEPSCLSVGLSVCLPVIVSSFTSHIPIGALACIWAMKRCLQWWSMSKRNLFPTHIYSAHIFALTRLLYILAYQTKINKTPYNFLAINMHF